METKTIDIKRVASIFIPAFILALVISSLFKTSHQLIKKNLNTSSTTPTLWKYQCIDTMKTSRDKARAWKNKKDVQEHIDREMTAIQEMGANCVAIATPYDEEFLHYLQLWVRSARSHNLHIWFRGNFSAWEGWFEYTKGMSAEELFAETEDFIQKNSDLFRDGDIFTAAPEAENGGPFEQVEKDEHEAFRKFLLMEYEISRNSFKKINKNVEVNWFSMNGGLAKRMMDQKTVDGIGRLVTIDHYIKTAPEMGQYIKYFRDNFKSQVAVGEFGAPIPEINGPMTDEEQSRFTEELFKELYIYKDDVHAINYWILYDGSTALLNDDLSWRPAAFVVQKYFKPNILRGTIHDTLGTQLSDVIVSTKDKHNKTITDNEGNYTLLLPEQSAEISIHKDGYNTVNIRLDFQTKEIKHNITLMPEHKSFFYWLRKK